MKIAVIYWSGTGNTEAMAKEVLQGALEQGASAEIYQVSEFPLEQASEFQAFALGCPSMGAEELEDTEFLPVYEKLLPQLEGKSIALFGSYDWGDGEWMRSWEEDLASKNLNLIAPGLIVNLTPEDDALHECRLLGKSLASSI